jgi:hypothetical protein
MQFISFFQSEGLLLLYWFYNPVWVLASSMVIKGKNGGVLEASKKIFGHFVTVNFSGVGSLAPRQTLNLEDQGLHFVWPLPFDLWPYQELTLPPAQLSGYWGGQTSSPR